MSSQEQNPDHAINWIIVEDRGFGTTIHPKTIHGIFSNDIKHRPKEEARLFQLVKSLIPTEYIERHGDDDSNLMGEFHERWDEKCKKLFLYPDTPQSVDIWAVDVKAEEKAKDGAFDKYKGGAFTPSEVRVTMWQGFNKNAAEALSKLLSGEDLGTLESKKPGKGLEMYVVCLREIPKVHVDFFHRYHAHLPPEEYKKERMKQYIESAKDLKVRDFPQIFFKPEDALRYAGNETDPEDKFNIDPKELSDPNQSERRALCEHATGEPARPYNLISIDYAHVNEKRAHETWTI